MRISYVEIQGFRKLERVRVDFNDTTTLFVGANNSGKTSAMDALCLFLTETTDFTTNDFTLSNWPQIAAFGDKWLKDERKKPPIIDQDPPWDSLIPTLDVWLTVEDGEFHYVRGILPTLDWTGGLLGVRLRFEPKDPQDLKAQYLAAATLATSTKNAGAKRDKGSKAPPVDVKLWPQNLRDFLDRKLTSLFGIRCYLLDPTQLTSPVNGVARPQILPPGSEPVDGKPLNRLVRINVIGAQRGFGGERTSDPDVAEASRKSGKLTEQLKSYYKDHLDPTEFPEPSDLDALAAIEEAQKQYDLRLKFGFDSAMKELEGLNYPGVTDPILRISTKLRPVDGLSHNAAVQYEVAGDGKTQPLSLPEQYNGLGYQNLISMVFRLMAFRDAWMRVGKASKTHSTTSSEHLIPPLHLVLVEEPEAHLHVQVQQVFVRKAYDVLRNHSELKSKKELRTQLVVSTHSSHIAHESDFSCLRYFRRLPKGRNAVPTSAVINLSEVFGTNDETARFVARYLRSTHCDLFFADAAILVEGAAERMLVPHFIKHQFNNLHKSYVTLLEISGSHAHRLRPLIETIGLITLAITDLDSVDPANSRSKAAPRRGMAFVTSNATLKKWHPEKDKIDDLLNVTEKDKVKEYKNIPLFAVRVAYQIPVTINLKGTEAEVISRTFEDALVLENFKTISAMPENTAAAPFKDAANNAADAVDLSKRLFDAVQSCDKAAFALDVLFYTAPETLTVPLYIKQGLEWLEQLLSRKQVDLLATSAGTEA